jgi:hypothetical protein
MVSSRRQAAEHKNNFGETMDKILVSVLAVLFFSASQASMIEISVTQSGSNVVFSGSGSVDLAGLGAPSPAALEVSRSQFNLFGGLTGTSDAYNITIPTFVPLNDSFFEFDSIAGDNFFVQGLNGSPPNFTGFLGVNSGYVSDTAMSFTWTVLNESILGLDLNFGTVAEFGNNTVTLIDDSSSGVPAPATIALLGLGLAGIRHQHRRRSTA